MPTVEGELLHSDQIGQVQPTGVAGELLHDLYAQLTYLVRARLGIRTARLFAQPVRGQGAGSTQLDWYAPCRGQVLPLGDLDAAVRTALLAEVNEMRTNLLGLAESLQNDVRWRGLLARAVPSDRLDRLYLVGDQPISTDWGIEGLRAVESVGPGAAALSGAAQPPEVLPATPEVPAPDPVALVTRRRRRWPAVAMLGSLLVAGGLVLLCRAGLLPFELCRPEVQVATAPPPLPPPVPPEERTVEVMVGRWRIATEWVEKANGQPLPTEFVFDIQGNGSRHCYRYTGEHCEGPMQARWIDDVRLRVRSGPTTCPSGLVFPASEILCEPSSRNEPVRCTEVEASDVNDPLVLEPVPDP